MTDEVRDKRDARRGVVDVANLLRAIHAEAQVAFYRVSVVRDAFAGGGFRGVTA